MRSQLKIVPFIILFLFSISFLNVHAQQLDQFGGSIKLKGKKTGKWHIEKINDRFWFITPEGNGFYVMGVNHVGADGEKEKLITPQRLKDLNMNTAAFENHFPHFLNLHIHNSCHWLTADKFGFADVFTEEFSEHLKNEVKKACENGKNNPNVIGYFLTDTPRYNLDVTRKRRGTDWVSFIRSLPENSAGKKRYIEFLKETYEGDIEKFKVAYRVGKYNSFEELLSYDFKHIELMRKAIRQDDERFLAVIVEENYRLTKQYFDEFHPNALILGEKFKLYDYNDEIIKLTGKYFDAVAIQPGPEKGPDVGNGVDETVFDPADYEKLYQLSGKPVIICDHGFSFATENYPRTLWNQFASEKEAGEFYDSYLQQVIKVPYIIGYKKCQYKSRFDPLRDLLKQGIIQLDGTPYPELFKQIGTSNQNALNQLYH